MDFLLKDLKANTRRRRSKQWIWESKRKILEMDTDHPMRYPLKTGLVRARRAPLITLQYPLQQPPHSQSHIQRHPHPQPLHLWLRVSALLVCLTPPMVGLQPRLRHLWRLQSENQ